ncbi:MAG: rab guanine nucleotide exchange factor S2 [Bathelium mastoideum]|nr:MAG: rab guanine nucleotide exchange factor S2 [Bathelium mastoideum]
MTVSDSTNSFLFIGGWGHRRAGFKRPAGVRSKSSAQNLNDSPISDANDSSPKAANMAAVQHPKSAPSYFHSRNTSSGLNTLPDPRSPSPAALQCNGSNDAHPDLSSEVATLSTKLINAINHQTNLDDSLQSARAELDAAREKIAQLEAANRENAKQSEQGLLVSRAEYDRMLNQFTKELDAEKQAGASVEREKKRIEGELESLTTALFEEANRMVAAARKDKEASETRNKQLRLQLNDTELLLASQQEQLQDLKAVMEKMESERDENESNPQISTAPSTPALDKVNRMFDQSMPSPHTPAQPINPEHPLHFDHLIQPVLRHDVQAYDDFLTLFKAAGTPPSRTPSGNYGSLLGLASLNNTSSTSLNQQSTGSTSKTSSRSQMAAAPSAASQSTSPNNSGAFGTESQVPPLKDTRFYKRILSEDIEPTLRLDLAPSLSFFNRRSLLSSIASGFLAIEPFSAPTVNYGPSPLFPCTLCGENRKGDKYVRRWRMKASDEEGAQRWALCEWCCTRVRSTAELAGFLRTVQRGMWRSTSSNRRSSSDDHGKENTSEVEKEKEASKEAWEECVRIRERMFWARVAGGVIPAAVNGEKGLGINKGVDSPMVGQASAGREGESQHQPKASTDEIRPASHDDEAESIAPKDMQDRQGEDPFTTAASQLAPTPLTSSPHRKSPSVSDRPLPIPHRQSISSSNGTASSSSIPLTKTLSRDLYNLDITAKDDSSTAATIIRDDNAVATPQPTADDAATRAQAVAARIRLFNEKEKGLGKGSRSEWQRGISSDARARSHVSDTRASNGTAQHLRGSERSKSPMPPIPTAGALHVRQASGEQMPQPQQPPMPRGRSWERSRERRSGPTEERRFDVERRVEEEVRRVEREREAEAEARRAQEAEQGDRKGGQEEEEGQLVEGEGQDESETKEEDQSQEWDQNQEPSPRTEQERESLDIPGAFA